MVMNMLRVLPGMYPAWPGRASRRREPNKAGRKMYPRSLDANEDFCNRLLNVGNALAVWAMTPPAMQMPMTMKYRITLEVVCEPPVQEGGIG